MWLCGFGLFGVLLWIDCVWFVWLLRVVSFDCRSRLVVGFGLFGGFDLCLTCLCLLSSKGHLIRDRAC